MEYRNYPEHQHGLYKVALKNPLRSLLPKQKNVYEDEDIRLWKEYKEGNQSAKWQLLDRFKGLISSIAMKQSNVLPKAVVEAKLKVYSIAAFDTYDPTKGAKLSTHVQNYLQKINRDNYTNQQAVRLPENLAIGFTRYMGAKSNLTETIGREPTTMELAQHLDWSPEQVANAERKYHTELVESKMTYDPGVIDQDVSSSAIRFAYQEMNDKERYLFEHKTGYMNKGILPMSVIREHLKVTPYQFNQMQTVLTAKLKDALNTLDRE